MLQSPDAPSQYIATMNAIFAAQRGRIRIDSCYLGPQQSAFLQQAAHLTGGTYLRPARPAGLLQYLLMVREAEWLAKPLRMSRALQAMTGRPFR